MLCRIVIVGMLLGLITSGCTRSDTNPAYIAGIDDATPFIHVEDAEFASLAAFAKEHGVDLKAEFDRAYDKHLESLAPIFKLSTKFDTLDKNARTYAQLVWNSLLNLGETSGVDKYAEVINAQNADVRQRIRDILFYPTVHLPQTMPERRRAEHDGREAYPELFPKDYEFGHNDPVFR